MKPFRGEISERTEKFAALHDDLCAIYDRRSLPTLALMGGTDSGASHYLRSTDEIVLCGRLSVVTYPHEFTHALGRNEHGAVRWNVNLFRQCFPRSFACCTHRGHRLVRRARDTANVGTSG